jgi:hypothetical protein
MVWGQCCVFLYGGARLFKPRTGPQKRHYDSALTHICLSNREVTIIFLPSGLWSVTLVCRMCTVTYRTVICIFVANKLLTVWQIVIIKCDRSELMKL